MKQICLLFSLVCFLVVNANLNAQVVAEGWRIASEVKATSDLEGAWDIIAGLDLDNDGNKEFIFSKDPGASGRSSNTSAAQSVYYYENTGDDTYELRWSFTAPINNTAENWYTAIAVGDVDSDGLPELYFGTPLSLDDAAPNPKGLYVFEFDGSNFPATPTETWDMGRPDNHVFKLAGLDIGDVDKDGEVELIVQSRGPDDGAPGTSGRTMIVANSGGVDIGLGLGAFAVEFENSSNHEGGSPYNARIVDFDGDGLNEIWVFTWDFWSLAIYEATAANTYELQVDLNKLYEPVDFGNRRGMRFYDADGDGKLEFYQSGIVADGAEGSYVYYIGSTDDVSTLTPTDVVQMGGKDLPYAGSAVGDIDGDGLMDFLFVARNLFDEGGKVYRMEYKGEGDLSQESTYDFSLLFEDNVSPSDIRNIAIADMDNDSKMDILITQLDVANTNEAVVIILESETPLAVEETSQTVQNFTLFQNYPNPFNPTTTINFDIATSQHVTLSVYNVVGKKVAALVDESLTAGTHTVDFNAGNLPSGIYYYTLEAQNIRITRQMLLLK